MLDDDVLFWIWRNLMLCVFPVCHHLFQPAPEVGLLTVDEVRRSFLELRLGLLPELLEEHVVSMPVLLLASPVPWVAEVESGPRCRPQNKHYTPESTWLRNLEKGKWKMCCLIWQLANCTRIDQLDNWQMITYCCLLNCTPKGIHVYKHNSSIWNSMLRLQVWNSENSSYWWLSVAKIVKSQIQVQTQWIQAIFAG